MYALGAASNQLITDVTKYTLGRLRPHFIDVCFNSSPNFVQEYNIKCYGDGNSSQYVYVTDYQCFQPKNDEDIHKLKDMRYLQIYCI